jgi:LacI family transcriptional regulator
MQERAVLRNLPRKLATRPAGLPDLFILQGIKQVISQSGMTLMIADTDGWPDRVAPLIQTFLQHHVEGLIHIADYHRRVALPKPPQGTPMVLANCFDTAGTLSILPDDERGQHALTARILAAGHQRIVTLTLRATVVATPLRIAGMVRGGHSLRPGAGAGLRSGGCRARDTDFVGRQRPDAAPA